MGTRAEVSFDLSGQNWDTKIDWYDTAGHLMVQDVNYDNGTSTETGYDTGGPSNIIALSCGRRIRAEVAASKNRNRRPGLPEVKLAA